MNMLYGLKGRSKQDKDEIAREGDTACCKHS